MNFVLKGHSTPPRDVDLHETKQRTKTDMVKRNCS